MVDGDTIEVQMGSEVQRVRYIGIDTPEMTDSRPAWRALAAEATRVNKTLVLGKTVELEKDTSEVDRYGRLLRYVYVDGTFVNAELVKAGLAEAKAYPPDTKYQSLFEGYEAEARQAKRGIWGLVER
ncbi:MAG: thermonuclease family protein [Chloroflexi bacterium]|nr:thermonuclease family protein [Chloroflexota bacterium]